LVHAALRAFIAVFRAVRGFFGACAAVFVVLGAALTKDGKFQLGLFRSAMVAMVQQLDARSFCFYPQLSVAVFLALVF
jgi:hypothetical protein